MKYIHFETKGFVIFDSSQNHNNMATLLGKDDKIISAGQIFCSDSDVFACDGESFSLNVKAISNDTEMLRRRFT